ncbi:thiamine phosphate synthase [Flammeovirga sp. EKP202]|uniref:thiamine phosphate synthase n=1 Tax=Flammeovirga sp. EKP202 TaxID=2770592 RepID=UPI00165FB0A4|nr:thiamine phosphate synthase [Flammeovirga sp. EKP202]MBD0401653.1 thiamine phosphate synthase [Flammeovirga sp. EKP202]
MREEVRGKKEELREAEVRENDNHLLPHTFSLKPPIIGLTKESFYDSEADQIVRWLNNGIDIIHLRKPNATEEEIKNLLEIIPAHFHYRITIHQHYHLTKEYNVGGIHFKESQRKELKLEALKDWKKKGLRLSSSVHQMDEISEIPTLFNYLFLSPVFDSTSKIGYNSNKEILKRMKKERFPHHQIIALGGITPKTLSMLDGSSFTGVAILGYLWNASSAEIKNKAFELQSSWKTLDLMP